MTSWYYMKDGRQIGPVNDEGLKRLAGSRRLLPSDQVWTEGETGWILASAVSGLFKPPGTVGAPEADFLLDDGLLEAVAAAQRQQTHRRMPAQRAPARKLPWIVAGVISGAALVLIPLLVISRNKTPSASTRRLVVEAASPNEERTVVADRKSDSRRSPSVVLPSNSQGGRIDAQADPFQNDPVASFKAYCSRFIKVGQEPGHDECIGREYSVDVRKTDSLVSPYIGVADVVLAPVDAVKGAGDPISFRLTFAAQDGKWVLAGVELTDDPGKGLSPEYRATFKDFLATARGANLSWGKRIFARISENTRPNP